MSKVDMQVESGEYFLSAAQKKQREESDRRKRQAENKAKRIREKEKSLIPPKEPIPPARNGFDQAPMAKKQKMGQN